LAFAGHRKEDYIDSDQNDPANNQNHLFGEHKSSFTSLTRNTREFRNTEMMMGSMISFESEMIDIFFMQPAVSLSSKFRA